jgi:hypothetical protein
MGYREASVLLGVLVIFLGFGTIPLLWSTAKRVTKT